MTAKRTKIKTGQNGQSMVETVFALGLILACVLGLYDASNILTKLALLNRAVDVGARAGSTGIIDAGAGASYDENRYMAIRRKVLETYCQFACGDGHDPNLDVTLEDEQGNVQGQVGGVVTGQAAEPNSYFKLTASVDIPRGALGTFLNRVFSLDPHDLHLTASTWVRNENF